MPTFIERRQIEVVDKALLDHLDAFSAPRLVEYFDRRSLRAADHAHGRARRSGRRLERRRRSARTVGASPSRPHYTVGEYDILILSAQREQRPRDLAASRTATRSRPAPPPILGSYIKQGMRFFVAKVNLKEQAELGFTFLRPLQVSYETPKFMLPIRLGTVNAKGPQDLFVFALTRTGRVETTNYRTVKLPTGMDLPLFVKAEFKDFYKAMFAEQVRKEDMRAVFLEYAWDMSWCDPCAADPLSRDQLRKLGVRLRQTTSRSPAYVSRLHVRYDAAHFPEDLVFQETSNRRTSRGGTSCAIPSRARRSAWRRRATRATSARGGSARPRTSRS